MSITPQVPYLFAANPHSQLPSLHHWSASFIDTIAFFTQMKKIIKINQMFMYLHQKVRMDMHKNLHSGPFPENINLFKNIFFWKF